MTAHAPLSSPALTIALALVAGMLAQSLARHLRVPGIVLLLAAGVLLGPDAVGIVRPDTLGDALHLLVGFAVAVVLFEGGMNLDIKRLRREAKSIRQLVTIGALVTALGGTLIAMFVLGWDWKTSLLFGSLVIVTGPTVVTPLLRRIRVRHKVGTVLEAEGVLIDAIGAIVAVVALEVVIHPYAGSLADAAWSLFARLGFGSTMGLAGGLLVAALLRFPRLVPDGLENVFTLSLALGIFQGGNAVFPESGIVAVTVAGLVVGNIETRVLADLREFKEQLTVMFIALLFVLLAADVRLEDVRVLGWPGLIAVGALMFVVRPLNVIAGTWGSDLSVREKLFICWIAPRGIVAAAVASLFAQSLTDEGLTGGIELRAMVFLVIAITVTVQGLSGGLVARLLDQRRPRDSGYVIFGANDLGRALGRALRDGGQEVLFLESHATDAAAAEKEGFRVLFGSGLRESILLRAELDGRSGCIALTANDAANLLYARAVRRDYKVSRVWVALRRGHENTNPGMVHDLGARVLFGQPRTLELWMLRLERGIARVERWQRGGPGGAEIARLEPAAMNMILPLAVSRGSRVQPVDDATAFKKGDLLDVVIFDEKTAEAHRWLVANGWEVVAPDTIEAERAGVPG